ncbi:variable surface lipoprotein [Mycoplasmopsis adleri]|uniref:variable surface lipoprotein n=1 Tax=Mycoplasmopsis adleri TaxID=51362 RepID=UPI0038738F15
MKRKLFLLSTPVIALSIPLVAAGCQPTTKSISKDGTLALEFGDQYLSYAWNIDQDLANEIFAQTNSSNLNIKQEFARIISQIKTISASMKNKENPILEDDQIILLNGLYREAKHLYELEETPNKMIFEAIYYMFDLKKKLNTKIEQSAGKDVTLLKKKLSELSTILTDVQTQELKNIVDEIFAKTPSEEYVKQFGGVKSFKSRLITHVIDKETFMKIYSWIATSKDLLKQQ